MVTLLAACSRALAGPVAAQDATGETVTLAAPARRIVSLAPHATELLFAAGAGDRVVGVLAPADWPPEAARLVRVGSAAGLDLERGWAEIPTASRHDLRAAPWDFVPDDADLERMIPGPQPGQMVETDHGPDPLSPPNEVE